MTTHNLATYIPSLIYSSLGGGVIIFGETLDLASKVGGFILMVLGGIHLWYLIVKTRQEIKHGEQSSAEDNQIAISRMKAVKKK